MKATRYLSILILLAAAQAGNSAPAQRKGILDGVSIRPLDFAPPKIETRELRAKGELLFVVNRELPMVHVSLQFDGGLDREPISRAGALYTLTRLLEIGGAGDRSGRQLQEALAQRGIRLAVKAGQENWTVEMTTLRDDFARAMDLLEEVLLRPRLPEEELAVVKNELLTSLRQRNDQPSSIANRKLTELLYAGQRRGYSLQATDVRRLSKQEAREEWERRVTAAELRVLLSGDVDQKAIKRVERLVALLPANPPMQAPARARDEDPFRERALLGKIVLVRKEAVQAVLVAGLLLPPHRHPDFFALQLCNQVLGAGSFNSRLMREIRVKRGLAYYAYSHNGFDAEDGRFTAGSATRVETAAQTFSLMLSTIDSMRSGVDEQELHLARESILNSLVFQFEDPASYLAGEARFRRHGLAADYLQTFPARMRGVADADIRRVALRLDPKNLYLVAVGPESMKASLEKVRPVVVIDPEEIPKR